jgi:hypothetical protein
MKPLILLLAAAFALFGCGRPVAWHQKLTLVILTPAGEVTGSSVVAIDARYFGQSIGNEVEYDFTGEAAVVEVLPGKYLFALLGEPGEWFYRAESGRFLGKDRGEWLFEIPKQRHPVHLYPDHEPMLVTFEDINKPETVKLVDPFDLPASFGPGVRVKEITLEITDEPVTEGKVEALLGWLEAVGRKQANLKGKPTNGLVSEQPNPELYMIAPSDFASELYK